MTLDAIRQIRFVYPPLVFASAIGIALCIDPSITLDRIPKRFTKDAAAAIAAFVVGSGALLACGYVIGSIPIFLMRFCEHALGAPHYESLVDESDHETLWRRVGGRTGQLEDEDRTYLAAAFNHGVVSDRLYGWLERRWNAFNIATHTATALALAMIVVHSNSIQAGPTWDRCVLSFIAMFGLLAVYTWHDVRAMTRLLARASSRGDERKRRG